MTQNKGTQITAPIVTPDSEDTFPTHINSMGKGGYKSVRTIAERDAIPIERREDGMLCGVIQGDTVYMLKGGTDNAFWVIFATGAGGATAASELTYTPTGQLISTNVQTAIDELETKKAELSQVYTKTEIENKLSAVEPDYSNIKNKPDLSSLHTHVNKAIIDKFSENGGMLAWGGKTIGDMVANIYDMDKDGIIDKAATLSGLTTTVAKLNFVSSVTSDIQAQINALSSGTVFKGEFPSYSSMLGSIPVGQKGFWVFITADENYSGAKTQYYHDGTNWIYGGGASAPLPATINTLGGVQLGGVLSNPNSTAYTPLLKATGVAPGTYFGANFIIDEDGRILYAENGTAAYVVNTVTNDKDTWSSSKIQDELDTKSDIDHTHSQLHDSDTLGNIKVNMANLSNGKVLTYDALTGKAKWADPSGGKVNVGSKFINGDFTLVAGSYISLSIDEQKKTITINSTGGGSGGGGGVPTLTEITTSVVIPAGSGLFFHLDASFSKYDIRTIEASNDLDTPMDLIVFDSEGANRRKIYQSNKDSYIYDIVNVPCHDKDETQKIHVLINNYGIKSINVDLIIATTNLL